LCSWWAAIHSMSPIRSFSLYAVDDVEYIFFFFFV
jgi:hypothetical protein